MLFRFEQQCGLSPVTGVWRVRSSERLLKALLRHVKAFRLPSMQLLTRVPLLRSALPAEGYLSTTGSGAAASKPGCNEGWTGGSCAVGARSFLSNSLVL